MPWLRSPSLMHQTRFSPLYNSFPHVVVLPFAPSPLLLPYKILSIDSQMNHFFFMAISFLFFLVFLTPTISSSQPCGVEQCGKLSIPSPFHLNSSSSCGPNISAFALLCPPNSSLPLLSLSNATSPVPVLAFLPSGRLLLDYSLTNSCYADLTDPTFKPSSFFALTQNNILHLYHCDDSSLCTTSCKEAEEGDSSSTTITCSDRSSSSFAGQRGCCYSLSESDSNVWRAGEGFASFSELGCRGFSSFVEAQDGNGKKVVRGIEIEWALPRRYENGAASVCVNGAVVVNSTAVAGGFRCSCPPGFVGDGFVDGIGCVRSSCSDAENASDRGCCKAKFCKKQVAILAGIIVSLVSVVVIVGLWFVLRHSSTREVKRNPDPCLPRLILGKGSKTRFFTYQELKEATNGFEEEHKITEITDGTVHTGVLEDGSLVAVQRINCDNSQLILRQVLERVENFSNVLHKNITKVIGYCIDEKSCNLILVHEFFFNRTLADLLKRKGGSCINWYNRMNIATEVASALTYLQNEVTPPIFLHGFKSEDVSINIDYSVKLSCFKFLRYENGNSSSTSFNDAGVIYCYGLILMELVTGAQHEDMSMILNKISGRKFEEIVDPFLRYKSEEVALTQRDQIERVACLAAECLSLRENSKLSLVAVAQELVRICTENLSSSFRKQKQPALKETFSNSSLLQMVSLSPESLHAHLDGMH